MDTILDLGIQITLLLQSLGDWLVAPMSIFSFLGSEYFCLLLAPVFYWCVDPQLGFRLGIGLMVSSYISCFFKLLLHTPRPYWYDQRVAAYSSENTFGLPSAHSQNAGVVWGMMAVFMQRTQTQGAIIALIFLIGLSRIYLGMHFITDVMIGWLLGALLLWILLKLEKPVTGWARTHTASQQILAALGISLSMLLLSIALRWGVIGNWALPQIWIETATAAVPDAAPIDPFSLALFVSIAGTFLGMTVGAILLTKQGGYDPQGSWEQYTARYFIGMIGMLVLWMGLGELFPRGDYFLAHALHYLRYGLTGLWITGLAPMLFIRLKLANKP